MQPFVVYDEKTGEIKRFGFAPPDQMARVKGQGEGIKLGRGTPGVHKVDLATGEIVPV